MLLIKTGSYLVQNYVSSLEQVWTPKPEISGQNLAPEIRKENIFNLKLDGIISHNPRFVNMLFVKNEIINITVN